MPAQSKAVRLYVEVAAGLRGLGVTPGSFELSASAPQQRLTVSGFFADGVTRDLSGPALGTTYTVDNPAIAHVSKDGLVTALAKGETVLRVTNRGVETRLSVKVQGGVRPADTEPCPAN